MTTSFAAGPSLEDEDELRGKKATLGKFFDSFIRVVPDMNKTVQTIDVASKGTDGGRPHNRRRIVPVLSQAAN